MKKKNILPLIDLAYQGFGDGINDDVKGVQYMASNLPEVCIGISCSKNFGLYRERVGAALVVVSDKKIHKLVEENLKSFNRVTFSFPPDYGASLVEIILGGNNSQNKELIHLWEKELNSMRNGMLELRKLLSDSLRRSTNSTRFDFIERHRGMFSLMGLTVRAWRGCEFSWFGSFFLFFAALLSRSFLLILALSSGSRQYGFVF